MGVSVGGGIKSVQRGVLTIAGGQTTATATIASVNLSKAEVRFCGQTIPAAIDYNMRLYLNNATTVGAIRVNTGPSTCDVTYEVTEWY